MLDREIEKAAELVVGLLAEAYSSTEVLIAIRGTLNKIQDDYILIPRKDGETLKKAVKFHVDCDKVTPGMEGQDSPYLPLLEAIEEALLAK